MSIKTTILFSICILTLAAALRLSNLNSLPIFADEAIYVRWSQVMRAEASLRFLPLSDGKQPLFMWATIPFLKFISDPLVAARTLSALTGLGTIIGIGFASYLVFKSWNHVLLATSVYATLPYAVFFDRMALADSMLAMFMVWGFGFSYLALSKLRLDMAMLAGFCLGFAWLTKSPAIFGLFLLPSLFLFLPKITIKNTLFSVFLFSVTFAIAFAMYSILRLGQEFHMIAARNRDYVIPFSEVFRHPLDPLIPHLKDSFNFYFHFLTPLGLLFITIALVDRSHRLHRLTLAVWILVPVLVQSAVARGYTARYLFFTIPFASLLIAHGLYNIGQHTRKHFLALVSLTLFTVCGLYFDFQFLFAVENAWLPRIERKGYLEEWTAGQGIREIAQYLKSLPATQNLLVGSEGFFGTPFDGLQIYLNGLPNIRVVGVGVWIDQIDPKLKSALSDNRVFLVVNSSRFHADPAKLPLKLISYYPKASPPGGTADQLLFFEVTK